MATIGQEIKRRREKKEWSQKELSLESGVDPSVLSRLESDAIEKPTEETIRKLAKAFGISPAKLISFTQEEKESERIPLRVGFGHCIWAAPIIALIMEKRIAGYILTSYGYNKGNSNAPNYEPYWYEGEEIQKSNILKSGPSYVNCSDDRLIEVQNWEIDDKESSLRAYTADELVNLLIAEKVDCIIAPGEIHKSYSSLLVRCAYIMNTSRSGCSLLAVCNNLNTTYTDFETLLKNMQNATNGPVTTLFPRATIAEKQLEFYLGKYWKDLHQNYINVGVWKSLWLQLKGVLDAEGGFFFIGWEPQLSWIKKAIRDLNKSYSFIDVELPDLIPRSQLPDRREQYLTFEIMFRKTSKMLENVEVSNEIKNFFALVNAAITEVSSIPNQQAPVNRLIAKYLDMNSEVCYQTLSSLNFALRFYPDWIEFLQRR
jgi:transcriptional regulator with XRE-family HTH domain